MVNEMIAGLSAIMTATSVGKRPGWDGHNLPLRLAARQTFVSEARPSGRATHEMSPLPDYPALPPNSVLALVGGELPSLTVGLRKQKRRGWETAALFGN